MRSSSPMNSASKKLGSASTELSSVMDFSDQLPCADPFICKAAALTKQIRMGPVFVHYLTFTRFR